MLINPRYVDLTPAAYEREAQRLRRMAHRAANCRDLTPYGMNADRYPNRLERLASGIGQKGN